MSSSGARLFTDDDVYLGVWTNWSRGHIHGATLTLSRRDGGLLIAFLALFVTTAGTSFWRICCFFLHRYLSSENARDALYHQRQAILRNANNTTSGAWALLRACWAWRRNNLAPYQCLLPSTVFAILMLMAFTLAGIFSSEVTTSMGREVLLKGSNCGSWMTPTEPTYDYWAVFMPYASQRRASSMAYAQRCYHSNANPRDCAVYLQPRLKWTADRNATCPFPGGEDICHRDSGNLRLDSGYIESDGHLGINSPSGTRFRYRSVAECAPLKTNGYTKNATVVPPGKAFTKQAIGRNVTQYFYGKRINTGFDLNFTYQYSADKPMGPAFHHGIAFGPSSDYALKAHWTYADMDGTLMEEQSTFDPIPALGGNETDLTLFFLSANDVTHTTPCDDPWYAAHLMRPWHNRGVASPNATIPTYLRDEPTRALGCATRYQFCNPDSEIRDSCTPLTGIYSATMAADKLWRTDEQREFFNTSSNQILKVASGLVEIVSMTGISSLTARQGLANGMQGPLPSNQWQLEVENWFGATMADLQRATLEHVTGPTEPAMLQFLERPQTHQERLKIRSDAFTSFSVLGLGILLGLGGLIIIASYTIEPLAGWADEWLGSGSYKRLEWATNDTLQLQRLAHEELGCGTWVGEDFPLTAAGERLAVLDISDPSHPKLVNPALMDAKSQDCSNPCADA